MRIWWTPGVATCLPIYGILPNHTEIFKLGVLPLPLSLNRLHSGERLYLAPSVRSQFQNRLYGGEGLKANATAILESLNRLNRGEKRT